MFDWLFKSGGNLGKEKSLEEELFSKGLYNIREPVFAVIKATKDLSRWGRSSGYPLVVYTDKVTRQSWTVNKMCGIVLDNPWMSEEENKVLYEAFNEMDEVLKQKLYEEQRYRLCSLYCTNTNGED